MNKITRVIFQLILWLLVLIIIGLNQKDITQFLIENLLAYTCQAILIVTLIYVLAPKLLFNKKHLQFVLYSVILVFIAAFISSIMIRPHGGMGMPPPPGRGDKMLPSPIFINLLLITVSYVFATFLETFAFAQKKEEALIISKSEMIENELKFLKSQINPHFLFNSLNNIYSLSMIGSAKAQQSILYLSDMLRYVLYDCEKPVIAIEKEVTYIKDFIQLFMLKSSKEYPITTSFTIEDPKLQIAPMLLIPFVENAFKHSNIQNIKESSIAIRIHSTSTSVLFSIENTFKKGPIAKDGVGGIGIPNVKKRLLLLYPDAHSLEITENSNTFNVQLKMELNV